MIMDNEGVISSCVWAVGQMGYEVSLMVGQNQLDDCQKINKLKGTPYLGLSIPQLILMGRVCS